MKQLKTPVNGKALSKCVTATLNSRKSPEKIHPEDYKLIKKGLTVPQCHIKQILDYVAPICAKLYQMNEKLENFVSERTEALNYRLDVFEDRVMQMGYWKPIPEVNSVEKSIYDTQTEELRRLKTENVILAYQEFFSSYQLANVYDAARYLSCDLGRQSDAWLVVRNDFETACVELGDLDESNTNVTCYISHLQTQLANWRVSAREMSIEIYATQEDVLAVYRMRDALFYAKQHTAEIDYHYTERYELASALQTMNRHCKAQIYRILCQITDSNKWLQACLESDHKCDVKIGDLNAELDRSQDKFSAAKRMETANRQQIVRLTRYLDEHTAQYQAAKESYIREMESLLREVAARTE